VCKSVNTKTRIIKISIIYLLEEQYKCAQVHKHKAVQDKKYLSEEECKCAQVRRHKATHEIKEGKIIRRGVQVCASW
jgi:hypothetical protein